MGPGNPLGYGSGFGSRTTSGGVISPVKSSGLQLNTLGAMLGGLNDGPKEFVF